MGQESYQSHLCMVNIEVAALHSTHYTLCCLNQNTSFWALFAILHYAAEDSGNYKNYI